MDKRRAKRGEAQAYLDDIVLKHESDECLYWPFARNDYGYGLIGNKGVSDRVHRIVCRKIHGDPPSSQHISAHSCGKGHLGCVSPKHVRWATRSENESDKVLHGTSNRGERSAHARLNEEKVREIRASSSSIRTLAKLYGVNQASIWRIKIRRNWSHVSD